MSNTNVIPSNSFFKFVSKSALLSDCLFFIHSFLLLALIVYQFVQPLFLNADSWVDLYWILAVVFSVDFLYFYFYEKIHKNPIYPFLFLSLDAVLMTFCFSKVVPVLSPILVFIYMIQILSAGFLGQYKGAFLHGLLVSFLFSWFLILNPSYVESTESLVAGYIFNNLGFIAVAALSGFLGQQVQKSQGLLKMADKTFHQLENLNALILNNINMGILILDSKTHVIYSNPQAVDMLKLSSGFSSSVYTVFPNIKGYIDSKKKEESVFNFSYEYNMEGDKKWIDGAVSAIDNPRDLEFQYLVFFQDRTKQHKMEQKIQEKERLSSIGRMAIGIAHELRNPLSSIGGSIQLLDLDKNRGSENNKLINIALREVSRLNAIIGEFLDYARDESASLEKVPMEVFSVNPILEELWENVRVNPKWDHIKPSSILQSQGFVAGHSDKFKQIFLNLIKNACEAMEGEKSGLLELESFDDKNWVVVRVKDSGVGMSDIEKKHIYEPFYSTKEKGTGLGLSIVRKLVSFYKGDLSYDRRDKGGIVFTLRFPVNMFPKGGESIARKINQSKTA